METLEYLSFTELKQFCRNNNIKGFSKFNKSKLLVYVKEYIAAKNSLPHDEKESDATFSSFSLEKKRLCLLLADRLEKMTPVEIEKLREGTTFAMFHSDIKRYSLVKKLKEKILLFDFLAFSSEKVQKLSNEKLEELTASISVKTLNLLKLIELKSFENIEIISGKEAFVGEWNGYNTQFDFFTCIEEEGNKITKFNLKSKLITTHNCDATIDQILLFFKGVGIISNINMVNVSDPKNYVCKDITLKNLLSLLKIQGYFHFKEINSFCEINRDVDIFELNSPEEEIIKKLKKLIIEFDSFEHLKTSSVLYSFGRIFPPEMKYYPIDEIETYNLSSLLNYRDKPEEKQKLLKFYNDGDYSSLISAVPGRFGEFDFYQFREIKLIEETMNLLSSFDNGKEEIIFSLPILMIREVIYLNTLRIFKKENSFIKK